MTRGKALTLGALSLWPIFYTFLFMFYVFSMMGPGNADSFESSFFLLMGVHMLTMVQIFAMVGYYIYHAMKSDMDQTWKIVWAFALFQGNMLALPVYWYLNVWRKVENEPTYSLP